MPLRISTDYAEASRFINQPVNWDVVLPLPLCTPHCQSAGTRLFHHYRREPCRAIAWWPLGKIP